MTAQQPQQGPPVAQVPLFLIPVPTNVQVGSERGPDGKLVVSLTIMRPMGTQVLVLSADEAKALASQITEAATGIEVARPGLLFVDDILKEGRPK